MNEKEQDRIATILRQFPPRDSKSLEQIMDLHTSLKQSDVLDLFDWWHEENPQKSGKVEFNDIEKKEFEGKNKEVSLSDADDDASDVTL